MAFEADIIELKKERFFDNRNNIGFMLWFIIIIMLLLQYIFEGIGGITSFVVLACLLGILVLRIIKFGKDNIPFKVRGILFIDDSIIQVPKQSFHLIGLKAVKIEIHDFEKKRVMKSSSDFRGAISAGVENFLTIETLKEDKFIFQFKLTNKSHHQLLMPFIIKAIKLNKMKLEDACQALQLDTYKKIQDFKEEVTKSH